MDAMLVRLFILFLFSTLSLAALAKEPVAEEQAIKDNGTVVVPPGKLQAHKPTLMAADDATTATPKVLKLPTPLIVSLMQYLAQRPTGETATMFIEIQHCLQAQASNGSGVDMVTKAAALQACPAVEP